MNTLLLNITDKIILNEAPKGTVVISTLNKKNEYYFKNKFKYYSTYDVFHEPLIQIKKNKNLVYPTREELQFIFSHFINFSFQINRWTNIKCVNYKVDQKILFEYLVFFLTIIHNNSIQKCFIDEDPHRAFDYVAYLIFKYKKIPCYILANMNFGDYRTFIKTDIEKDLKSSLDINKINKKLLRNVEKAEVNLQHVFKNLNKKNNFSNYFLKILSLKEIKSFLKRIREFSLWHSYIRPKPSLPIFYTLKKIDFYHSALLMRLIYKLFFKVFSKKNFRVKGQDIVFYSHYFPERTTIPLSHPFGYQMLDCISILKETNNRIIYKEHPTSLNLDNSHRNKCHHDFYFMKNLLKTNIILVKNIIKNEHIVATLNGTVGLEFALEGYKVICFGNPWYAFLPNVYIYKDISSMQDFIDLKTSFKKEDILDCLILNTNQFSSPFCINNRYKVPTLESEKLKKIFCKFIYE